MVPLDDRINVLVKDKDPRTIISKSIILNLFQKRIKIKKFYEFIASKSGLKIFG